MLVWAALVPAGANATGEKKAISYRWVDEQGIVHYGDSIPPQYAEKAHELINNQGVEVGHTEAQRSPEQLAIDAREHAEALKQQQHDSFLVATYTSVKDIESLRDVRLEQLQGQRVAAEQYVENLHSRMMALQSRARHFRPYNVRADAHKVPDDLAEDMVRALNELRTQTNALTAKNEEMSALRAQFQSDIERYRALHEPHLSKR